MKSERCSWSLILYSSIRLTCSSLSVLCVRLRASLSLFLPLSPAEPSGPGQELSTGVFIPAVIWASISSKLLHRDREQDMGERMREQLHGYKNMQRSSGACRTLCRGSWAQIHGHTYSWLSCQRQSLTSGTKMASSQTEATRHTREFKKSLISLVWVARRTYYTQNRKYLMSHNFKYSQVRRRSQSSPCTQFHSLALKEKNQTKCWMQKKE